MPERTTDTLPPRTIENIVPTRNPRIPERLFAMGLYDVEGGEESLRRRVENEFGEGAVDGVSKVADAVYGAALQSEAFPDQLYALGSVYSVGQALNNMDPREIGGILKKKKEAYITEMTELLGPESSSSVIITGTLAYAAEQLPPDQIDDILKRQCERIAIGKPPQLAGYPEAKMALDRVKDAARIFHGSRDKQIACVPFLVNVIAAELHGEGRFEQASREEVDSMLEERLRQVGMSGGGVVESWMKVSKEFTLDERRQLSVMGGRRYEAARASQRLIQLIASGELRWSEVQELGHDMNERWRRAMESGEPLPLIGTDKEAPITNEPFQRISPILPDDRSGIGEGEERLSAQDPKEYKKKGNTHRKLWLRQFADQWQDQMSGDDPELEPEYFESKLDKGAYYAVAVKERIDGRVIEHVFVASTRPGDRDAPYVLRGDHIPAGMTWQQVLAGTKTEARRNGALRLSNQRRNKQSTPVTRALDLLSNQERYAKRRYFSKRLGRAAADAL